MTLTMESIRHKVDEDMADFDLEADILAEEEEYFEDEEEEEDEEDPLSQDTLDRMLAQLSNNNHLDSAWEVMGEHKSYLFSFLRTHATLLRGDGPLAAPVRHYLAIMAASRHSSTHLIENHKVDFLADGGKASWIEVGLEAVPPKIQRLSMLNKLLAHQPWSITAAHIKSLTHSQHPDNWSLSELVYAIVLMAHFHSFSSFMESCVLMETKYKQESKPVRRKSATSSQENRRNSAPYDCTDIKKPSGGVEKNSPDPEGYRVDALLERMEQLRAQNTQPNSEELSARFRRAVELSSKVGAGGSLGGGSGGQGVPQQQAPPDITKFMDDPDFHYVDFAQRKDQNSFPTFRIQDYNWDDQCYSLMSRFYDDITQLLDDKFRLTYNMTYGTMGRLTAVDTSMFRRAVWNYIQCLYGIRWDDYDYAEVNDLLDRSLKKYIKIAACFPEESVPEHYTNIMKDFLPSEKIHVCLIVAEAKFQSELLYALRALATHFSSCNTN